MAHLQILLFLKQIHARLKINVTWGMFEVQMNIHQPYPSKVVLFHQCKSLKHINFVDSLK